MRSRVSHHSSLVIFVLFLLVLSLSSLPVMEAFQAGRRVFHPLPRNGDTPFLLRQRQRSQLLFSSSSEKDEEIAKLEAQLQKLKEEATTVEASAKVVETDPKAAAAADENEEETIPESMFLSENWKEKDSEEEPSISLLTPILGAIGLAVFLAIFSQIPIGQEDYSKYSAVNAPTAMERIDLGDLNRARQQQGNDL
eukprot:scaffold3015_cov122-Cylindrotheca_fusiformis.AAC.15